MSDVPRPPSSPCEVEPVMREVLRVAAPLLAPPTASSTSSQSPDTSTKTEDSGNNEDANQVKTNSAKGSSRRPEVKGPLLPVGQLSTLAALMVTFGPHGFMILRRCEEGTEDSPLLSLPAEQGADAGDICQEGTYHSLDRAVGLYFPPPDYDQIISVSGAGDCLASGFVTGMLAGLRVSECAAVGNTAARLSLQALPTVPPTLSGLRAAGGGESLQYKLIC